MSTVNEDNFAKKLKDDAEFLKTFADRLIGDVEAGTVVSATVILTLAEYSGKIIYNAGRYNQLKVIAVRIWSRSSDGRALS